MNKINVAIADDQILFLKGLKFILESFEDVELQVEATNGKELIEKLKIQSVDLILMDLKMPEMNGMEATQRIKELYPEIKIIFLSMHDDQRLISHMMKIGANGYLLKNESPETVHKAIQTVIETGFYFNDYVSKALLNSVQSIKLVSTDIIQQIDQEIYLTKRELEVLELICKAYTATEIAKALFISKRTAEGHRKNLLEKTGAKNTAALVVYAIKNSLVKLN